MARGVALHDLVYDERGEGSGAKHGQQLERDDRRVCGAPACVGSGVFAPYAVYSASQSTQYAMSSLRSVLRNGTRTHLRESALGCIYGTSEGRQGEEGALEDKVDERVKRLSFRFSGLYSNEILGGGGGRFFGYTVYPYGCFWVG
jgi:hypothetical protein